MCDIRRVKIVIEGKTTEQIMDLKYSGNGISEFKNDIEHKLQTYSRINAIIKTNFGKKKVTIQT
jgi:hypothetical protein